MKRVKLDGAGRRPVAAVAALVAILLATPIEAQIPWYDAWEPFETEVVLGTGAYAAGWGEGGFESMWSLRLRQTVVRYGFFEVERMASAARLAAVCTGFTAPCPTYPQDVEYTSLGGGLQLPLGRFRPHAGASAGRMNRPDQPTLDSYALFAGAEFMLVPRVRLLGEYRVRADEVPDRVWSPEWVFGVSARIF